MKIVETVIKGVGKGFKAFIKIELSDKVYTCVEVCTDGTDVTFDSSFFYLIPIELQKEVLSEFSRIQSLLDKTVEED